MLCSAYIKAKCFFYKKIDSKLHFIFKIQSIIIMYKVTEKSIKYMFILT